jgi:hypothetical protein
MARKAVVDAVEARLATLWNGPRVVGLNTFGEAPEDGSAFVVVQYPVANEEQITVGAPGNNIFREEGAIRFVINAVRGSGQTQALLWADELAALFRAKEFDGVRTFAPDSPAIDDRNDEGNYYSLAIVVPYWHDITG